MDMNTSVAIGEHFQESIKNNIKGGRYKNASEVIRASLRLLEEKELKFRALRSAVQEGMNNGVAECFNPTGHLKELKNSKSA